MCSANERTLVSVVIPVFNVLRYIDRCLGSVCDQSFSNLQILVIDDGSTDGSGEACDRWASSDSRVVATHTVNSGLSAARNVGMRQALGDYVVFVDSDDYIGYDHIRNLLLAAQSASDPKRAVAVTGFTKCVSEDAPAGRLPSLRSVRALSAEGAIEESVTLNGKFGAYAWGKLYPRILFSLLLYPVGRYFEDQFVTYKVFLAAGEIVYEDANDYLYFAGRPGSITAGSKLRELDYLDAIRETLACVEVECPNAVGAVQCRYLGSLIGCVETSFLAGDHPTYNRLYSEAVLVRAEALECDGLPRRIRTRYSLLSFGNQPYGGLLRLRHASKCLEVSRLVSKAFDAISFGRRRTALFRRYSDELSSIQGRRAFLLMTPRYRNYGDHLIAISERQLLEEAGWDHIVEVPYEDCSVLGGYVGRLLKKGDAVFFTGGGYLGDLWPGLERAFERVLGRIPEWVPVLLFPQSVSFLSSKIEESRFVRTVVSRTGEIVVLCREGRTFDSVSRVLGKARTGLYPDVGLFVRRAMLLADSAERDPGLALVCVRRDKESIQSASFGRDLTSALNSNQFAIRAVDTHDSQGELPPEKRVESLNELARTFASAGIVVTNRLHGMILAMIAGTPCVALDNISGKVFGVASWVMNDYPVVLAGESDLEDAIARAKEMRPKRGGVEGLLDEERLSLLNLIAEKM